MSSEQGYPSSTIPGYVNETPGIQIGTQMRPDASEEEMTFARQLGVQWVMTGFGRDEDHSLENYIALKKRFEDHGLKIYRLTVRGGDAGEHEGLSRGRSGHRVSKRRQRVSPCVRMLLGEILQSPPRVYRHVLLRSG